MIVRAIESFARMASADRGIVVRAASRLLRERMGIGDAHLVPTDCAAGGRIDAERARRLAHLVRRTAESLPFRCTCLDLAIVLASLLRDEGLRSILRIGVHADWPDHVDAHAWVEHGELSLFDEEQYLRFETALRAEWR